MPGAGRSAGRVSIRVVPDSTKFREDLKKTLDRIEKVTTISIPVTADTSRFRESLKSAQEQTRKLRPTIPIAADLDKFKREVQTSVRRLTQDPATLALDLQVERAQRDLRAFRESKGTGPLTVEVQAEVAEAERQVDKLIREVNRKKAEINIQADLNKKKLTLELKAASRRRTVEFLAKINKRSLVTAGAALARLSGGRVLTDRLKGVGQALANLDRSTPKIAGIGLAIANLGSLGLASVGGLLNVAASLTAVAGAGIALPGILAGGAIALGVLTAALADAKTELASLAPAFASLQDSISAKFWDQAKQPILDLVNSQLPSLRTGLAETATQLGGIVAGFTGGLQSALGGGVLDHMLDNLNTGLGNARLGAEAIAQAFVTLGSVGSQYLPGLGTAVSNVANRFSAFVQQAADDGRLQAWIDNGITALGQLGSVVGSVARIVGGLFKAAEASGGGGLATLATTLQKVADIVNGGQFQQTLTTLFTGAAEGASILSDALGPIGSLLSALAPTIATIMGTAATAVTTLVTAISSALSDPAFATGLQDLFSGILAGVRALAPGIEALGPVLGSLGSVVGTLGSTLGQVLGAALVALAPVLTAVLDAVKPLIPILGTALVGAVQIIAPALLGFINQLAPLLPGLVASFAQLVVSIAPVIPYALQLAAAFLPLIPVIAQIVTAFAEANTAIMGVTTRAVPVLIAGLNLIVSGVKFVLNQVRVFLQVIAALFQGNFTKAAQIVSTNMTLILSKVSAITSAILGKITSWLGQVVGGIAAGFARVVATVAAALGRVVSTVTSGFSRAYSAVSSAMSRIVSGVETGVGRVLGFFSALPGRIVSALGNLGSLLYSAGRDVVSGFISGITGAIGGAAAAAANLGRTALAAARNAIDSHSPSKEFAKVGRDVVLGFAQGILGTRSQATAAINKVITDLKNAYSKRNDSIKSIDKQLASIQSSRIKAGRRLDAAEDRLNAAKTAKQRKAAQRSIANARDDVKKYLAQAKDLRSQKSALQNFSKADYSGLLTNLRKERTVLDQISKQRDALAAKIKTATSNLTAAIKLRDDYSKSVKAGIVGLGDVTQFQSSNGRTDANFITTSLQAAVDRARKFRDMIKQLKKDGLNNATLKQLVDKGAEAGSSVAQALLDGGSSTIKKTNQLQTQLTSIGADLGKFTSSTFYQAGVDSARGILDGLKSQKKALDDAATALAKSLAKAVKKALGIKSPSKVFRRQVGLQIPAGIVAGLKDGKPQLTAQLEKLVRIPELGSGGVRSAVVSPLGSGLGGAAGMAIYGGQFGYDPGEIFTEFKRQNRRSRNRANLQGANA